MRLKRLVENDFILLLSVSVLTFMGILFIYSSGITSSGSNVSNEYIKQIVWAIIGIAILLTISLFDYRRIYDFTFYIYIAMLLLLLYTKFFGKVVNGSRSWLGIGIFGFQISEFAKISSILFLAQYLDSSRHAYNGLKRFLSSCLIILAPMSLILLQPDLGTALVFIPVLIVMTFIAGTPVRYVVFLIACVSGIGFFTVLPLWQSYILKASIPILNIFSSNKATLLFSLLFLFLAGIAAFGYQRYNKKYFYWMAYVFAICFISLFVSLLAHIVLKEYQIMRLIVFLNPEVDPRGSGWNIIQSKTAIGSGGFWGKGFLQGTQSHYRFLPQQSTDFIFSIFSEETGFLGGLIVFILYTLISLRCIHIMKTTSDPFGAYIVSGIISIFIFHFAVNVGMTMGIMPITGIPLLLLSYGGSSLLSAMIGIGLIQSIYMRRYEH